MRTYGRLYAEDGTYTWVEVSTDPNGYDDQVWLTTLAQVLQLHLGESPFYANYGIPQYRSVVAQLWPDFYVAQTQQQFAAFFASLQIASVPGVEPQYNITATLHNGAQITNVLNNTEFPT